MKHPMMHDVPEQGAEAAATLVKAGEFGKALPLLLADLQADPSDLQALDLTATCYLQLGDGETAAKLLELLLEKQPELPLIWCKLAAVHATGGDSSSAARAYRQALRLAPGDVRILAAFNQLETFARDSSHSDQLRAALQDERTSKQERITACFALAKIEDKADGTQAAFHYYSEANQLKDSGYDIAFQEQRVQAQLAADWSGSHNEEGWNGPRILFVTGLPRSGTTLLETCLTQHSEVASIGESDALSRTAAAIRKHAAVKSGDMGWWNWLGRLDREELQQFRALFRRHAFGLAPPAEPVVIDKMPLNCFEMGLAKLLLPDAKFLFLSRHPLDAGLSNFTMNFAYGNRFASKLEWIGHMTRCVYSSARDYQAKLGAALRVQSYEALATSPEEQLRQVLEHAGLAWEQGCLYPERNGRMVRTASLMQVRERIGTGALGKWRRYEAQLAPLRQALGGEDWIGQWQQWDRHAADTGRFPLETA